MGASYKWLFRDQSFYSLPRNFRIGLAGSPGHPLRAIHFFDSRKPAFNLVSWKSSYSANQECGREKRKEEALTTPCPDHTLCYSMEEQHLLQGLPFSQLRMQSSATTQLPAGNGANWSKWVSRYMSSCCDLIEDSLGFLSLLVFLTN